MPPSRSQVYVRRRILVFCVAVLTLALLFYLPITLLAPMSSTPASRVGYSAPESTAPVLTLPSYGASAIAAVGFPGLLASGGVSTPLPIASITKIITALVVLQKDPLGVGEQGPSIRFTAADEAILKAYAARDGDTYPIQVGGSLSELQVLTIALVPSANNYARALADWAYGSEANFLPVARAWLMAHGLTSTTLTDSTGLNPQNTSTPTDLIALGKLALASPVISSIISIRSTTLPVVGLVNNTNPLLGQVGVTGIKTGTLDNAGASLLFSSRLNLGGHVVTLIGVVLDGPTHPIIDTAIAALLTVARGAFHLRTLATKGQVFARYRTAWGAATSAVASRDVTMVLLDGTRVSSTTAANAAAPGKKGTILGLASFTAGNQRTTVPLVQSSTLKGPDPLWRLLNPGLLH
ncbi:MAG TPA: D-alanyl-D-alanine carboxypeptidase [Galbitalea sp.]|nr:D-alanyl-D-alanine carboxypeptidase [Galbitalea sp.]